MKIATDRALSLFCPVWVVRRILVYFLCTPKLSLGNLTPPHNFNLHSSIPLVISKSSKSSYSPHFIRDYREEDNNKKLLQKKPNPGVTMTRWGTGWRLFCPLHPFLLSDLYWLFSCKLLNPKKETAMCLDMCVAGWELRFCCCESIKVKHQTCKCFSCRCKSIKCEFYFKVMLTLSIIYGTVLFI